MLFRNCDYFVAIVEAGSLTKAAEVLYVSQPSLSQYLKRLERKLGVELFDHSVSPLQLTYTGERYYQYVLRERQLEENLRKEFQDIHSEIRGKLRLGVALWRSSCLLPDVFPSFHQQYPDIRLELYEARSDQLEMALMNDKIDIAVMNLPHTLDYAKLNSETIFEEQIVLAAPTEHPAIREALAEASYLDGYPVISLDILKQIPLILTKPGQNLTHEVRHTLGKNHIEPDILLETGNLTTAINLVAKGMACVFVPDEGAKVCRRPDEVTYFTLGIPDLVWNLSAVYRKDVYLPKISRLFIDNMKQQIGGA